MSTSRGCCPPGFVWPVLDPGRLISLITFLSPVQVSDISGHGIQYLPSSPPLQAYADIRVLSVQDTIRAGQEIGTLTAEVETGYSSAIKDTMRFLSPNGGTWQIKAINNVSSLNIKLIMTCISIGPTELA